MRSGPSAITGCSRVISRLRSSGTASRPMAYLVVAAVLIVCAFLALSGSQLGRWVRIVAGAIGCISAIWWMPFYPIWSLTYIALGVLVISALAAYGGKAEAVWQGLVLPSACRRATLPCPLKPPRMAGNLPCEGQRHPTRREQALNAQSTAHGPRRQGSSSRSGPQ